MLKPSTAPLPADVPQEREVAEASGQENPHLGKLRALVLAPTRELALQVRVGGLQV